MSTMRLPVKLTKGERLALADEQAVEQAALEAVEAEKKAKDAGFNAKIKQHKKGIHDRNQGILTGVLDREVEVRQLLDVEKGRVKVIRLDTFEVVSDRAMDDEERQLRNGLERMPTVTDKTADEDRERTDEQKNAASPEEAEQIREERLAEEVNDRVMGIVAGLMLMAKVEPAADGSGQVTVRVEEGDIVAEATAENENVARGEIAQVVVAMVKAAEVKRAAAAAAKPSVAEVAPSAFVLARYEAIADEIVVEKVEATGAFVAVFETAIALMEAEGATEAEARDALRKKLFAKFAEDERKLAGGGAPPKTGLQKPKNGSGGKGKSKADDEPPAAAAGNGAKPKAPAPEGGDGDGAPPEFPPCPPGCQEAHVHSFAPGEDGLAF